MTGPSFMLALLLVLPLAGVQSDAVSDARQQLRRLAAQADLTAENVFLHAQVTDLLERWRRTPAESFLAGRLQLAMLDLLHASELILDARAAGDEDDKTEETRRLMSRDLERTYFRLQQGDYFAGQSQDGSAPQYVPIARRLYQFARTAYDERQFGRVRMLSEASREVIAGLEKLAQAARGVPDPPRLPER